MLDEREEVRWSVSNPFGAEIILKAKTYEEHVMGDYNEKDSSYRKMLECNAKQVLTNPRYIINDNARHLYYDLILADEHLRIMKVVVEIDRVPNEVVTWAVLRKGEIIRGEIIYDISSD